MRLVYNQAPNLAYWWIDDFVDLNETQSGPLRSDLETFAQWHRSQELPLYVQRLKHWQTLATQDLTPDQACAQFDAVRAAYLRGVERALPPLTRVALSLQAPQFEALGRKQAKSSRQFEKEWLTGTREERLNHRLKQTMKRYEHLYGDLSAAQRQLLEDFVQRSAFDPTRMQAERQRRHTDLLASLQRAQNQTAQAQTLLRRWHERVMRSPDATYAAYSEASVEENCAQFAMLHNTTSDEQRVHAVQVLKGYEADLQALSRAR